MSTKETIKSGFPPVLVNRVDGLGRTALMKCGYDPQVTDRGRLDEDCAKISTLLIEAGMDIHVADVQGWTAMAYAASMGFTEVRTLDHACLGHTSSTAAQSRLLWLPPPSSR